MAPAAEQQQVILEVAAAFDKVGVPYAVGGSVASSLFGIPRFTQDADFTAEPFPGLESQFAACFEPDYYLSVPSMVQANRARSTFNIIHIPSGFKVDVFVRKDRPFEKSAMARRQSLALAERPIVLVTPEDIVLFKLEWYRLGEESSDRQWSDIRGVLQVRAGQLDEAYLDRWADELGVRDLLELARREARPIGTDG